MDPPEIIQTAMEYSGSANRQFASVCKKETRILPPIKMSLCCLLLKAIMKIYFYYYLQLIIF